MKKLATFAILLFSFVSLYGQTNVSGSYLGDSTWTLANSPYVVTGYLEVKSGASLTIETGVEVKFNSNIELRINGVLNADGVTFTSNQSTKAREDWYAIRFYNDSDTSYVSNSTVEYSTHGLWVQGLVSLDNVNMVNNRYGLRSYYDEIGGYMKVRNCTFSNNQWPIYAYYPAFNLDIDLTSSFSGNDYDAIYIDVYNYKNLFGDVNVYFPKASVPYYISETLTVLAGDTLEVGSGSILKFNRVFMYVQGKFTADADVGDNIWFTAWTDDNLDGDSNDDGTSTSPYSQYWYGIQFDPGSDGYMRRAVISYAGYYYYQYGAIDVDNASPVIDHCEFKTNYYGISLRQAASPILTNNTFGSSEVVPIAMSFEADPVFLNNSFSFSDNQYDAIGLLGGTLTADAHLIKRDVTDIPNVTYLVLGDVTVPENMSLEIDKGVVVKFLNYSYRLFVHGTLSAIGSSDSLIVFTSVKDDNHGNPQDTNKDGTNTVPAYSDWGGIFIYSTSDTTSHMEYSLIKYGYYQWGYYFNNENLYPYSMLTVDGASPTIRNCEFKNERTSGNYVSGIGLLNDAAPVIEDNVFSEINRTPIALMPSAHPTLSGNTFNNVGMIALGIIGHHLYVDGSLDKRTVGGYDNITYVLLGDLTIVNGAMVTVDPGVVVKVFDNVGIYVEGALSAEGTGAENIVFTSIKDDNHGNPQDTNDDGNDTAPARGNWRTIRFSGTSDDALCKLDNVKIYYGGYYYYYYYNDNYGSLSMENASPSVKNTLVSSSNYYGIKLGGDSSPLLENVTIENSNIPIGISFIANPTFTNITYSGNDFNVLGLVDVSLGSDATLSPRSLAGFDNMAYALTSGLTINNNVVLTLEPGVIIKPTYYYNGFTVNGALRAMGTEDKKVVFTSINDDSFGGDSNADGNNSSPGPGNWGQMYINSSNNDSLNIINNTVLRYASNALVITEAYVEVDSTIIELNSGYAMGIFGNANPLVHNSEFVNIGSYPIYMSMFAEPVFENNTALNNRYMAIGIKTETFSNPATIPLRDFAGYNNITYMIETLTINTGTTINIPAGAIFKSGSFIVNGALNVMGTAGNPVVFTDLEDDEYGNPADTENNGYANSPSRSYSRITFNDVSSDTASALDHVIVRWSDQPVVLNQASPSITNSVFENSNFGIGMTGVCAPIVENNEFNDLTYTPLYMSLLSFPSVYSGNTLNGTTYKSIGVRGETLTQDFTMQKRNFGGIINIPYFFYNTYTVGTSAVLTVEPGVVAKFNNYARMVIRRGLIMDGGNGSDSTIVFTHISDDYYGGDSNSDGDATKPGSIYYYYWSGIQFTTEALDPSCLIDNSVIMYTGYYGGDYAIQLNSNNFAITNSTIANHNQQGIELKGSSNPIIQFNDFYNINSFAVNNTHLNFAIDASNNWWGDDSGPTHADNPGGTGIAVTDSVNYLPFISTGSQKPLAGDVSLNGAVQAYDASLTLQSVAGTLTLSTKQQIAADVSGDAGVTAYDASLVLQYVVGKIGFFPVEGSGKNLPQNKIVDATPQWLALLEKPQASMRLNEAKAKTGEEFYISLSLDMLENVSAMQFKLKFDPESIDFVGASTSRSVKDMLFIENINHETGEMVFAFAGSDLFSENGEVLNLKFSANEGIKGESATSIEVLEFLANEKDLTGNSTSGQVSIEGLPVNFELLQNYPNPFNGTTKIQFKIPEASNRVSIVIYDVSGRKIKTLVNRAYDAGNYTITWDGTNDMQQTVSSGLYFYRIDSGNFSKTQKLHFLK